MTAPPLPAAELVARLREMEKRATPGPWSYASLGNVRGPATDDIYSHVGHSIATCWYSSVAPSKDEAVANGNYIVEFRNSCARLLDTIEAQAAMLERAAAVIETVGDISPNLDGGTDWLSDYAAMKGPQ